VRAVGNNETEISPLNRQAEAVAARPRSRTRGGTHQGLTIRANPRAAFSQESGRL